MQLRKLQTRELKQLTLFLYFNLNLILVLISVVLTIIVLNFHFRGPKKQRVPKWMRKYIIGYIGRLFCFNKETYKYHLEEKDRYTILINLIKNNIIYFKDIYD